MTKSPTHSSLRPRPLRLWPGVVLLVLLWLARFVVPLINPEWGPFGVLGSLVLGLGILIWWVFFSRAPWGERLGAVGVVLVALFLTPIFLDPSIATGMMGFMFPIYAVPVLCLALVAWAVLSGRFSLPTGSRWALLGMLVLFAAGGWTLVRTAGITGDGASDFRWRWSTTAEERLLKVGADPSASTTEAPTTALVAETPWSGFRGPDRDGHVPGARIATDWSTSPPTELWRRPVGPGWSSFAVQGNRVYTQEQRGEEEVVSAYDAASGDPLWMHQDPARFWESNAGAGPRATPTLFQGRIFAFGATGLLNALRADDGTVLWSRDVAADTGAEVPMWGFASSPLVIDDLVVVAAAGVLVAYDLDSGEPRWFGPEAKGGYSSPHLAALAGVQQILQLRGKGLVAVAVADGTVLWEHDWSGDPVVQPALTEDGDVLIGANSMSGLRRLSVKSGAGGWTAEEVWTSRGLKPYFSDFVVHEGHAYGFDGRILSCIELENGERQWKGGRYGSGQLVLLPEQDLLLVISEEGELALVAAKPDGFSERARFPALEGKTWNHPVLVDDLLFVRNDREMVAFRLAQPAD